MDDLIQRYGYLAILLGAVLEGETVVLLGGFAAHQGHLNVLATIAAAFIGTLIADQFFFYLGRLKGQDYLTRRPAWQAKIGRVFRFIDSHQNLLMLGFRFLYGLRTIGPIALGMSRVPWVRFTALDFAAAVVWAVLVAFAGYAFGKVVTLWLGDLKRFEVWLALALIPVGAGLWWLGIRASRTKGK